MNRYTCPHGHTYIYTLKTSYSQHIKLTIENDSFETNVNIYPVFKNEIILSTIVKNEDNYIKQWINFHLCVGITRFIIYDNSDSKTLSTVLYEYIDKQQVILIEWNVPYFLPKSGFSGQTTQQNHSIYAFIDCKYIGLFDIDEYINIQNHATIDDCLNEMIEIYSLPMNKIGSFTIKNKFFYNPDNLPTEGNQFLNIFTCDSITDHGHEKNFVIPKNVNTFSVHMITHGHPSYNVPKTDAYFNHYYFLNKKDRGRNRTNQTDHSILLHLPNDICPSKQ
jgi:hypothetical protein